MVSTYIVMNESPIRTPAVILSEYIFWANHENELREWCHLNLEKGEEALRGSVLEFKDEKELVLFTLRWG